MKHFEIYRKLILIIDTATAVVSVGVFFFMEDILFRTLFISFAFVFLCGLLFLLDFLHNRYNDNLLEEITLPHWNFGRTSRNGRSFQKLRIP